MKYVYALIILCVFAGIILLCRDNVISSAPSGQTNDSLLNKTDAQAESLEGANNNSTDKNYIPDDDSGLDELHELYGSSIQDGIKKITTSVDASRAEHGKIKDIKGRLIICVKGHEPMLDAEFTSVNKGLRDNYEYGDIAWVFDLNISDKLSGYSVSVDDIDYISESIKKDINESSLKIPKDLREEFLIEGFAAPMVCLWHLYNRDDDDSYRVHKSTFENDLIVAAGKVQADGISGLEDDYYDVVTTETRRYWFSEEGHLRRIEQQDGSGCDMDMAFQDYKDFDGIHYPTSISVTLKATNEQSKEMLKSMLGFDCNSEETIIFTMEDVTINDMSHSNGLLQN